MRLSKSCLQKPAAANEILSLALNHHLNIQNWLLEMPIFGSHSVVKETYQFDGGSRKVQMIITSDNRLIRCNMQKTLFGLWSDLG